MNLDKYYKKSKDEITNRTEYFKKREGIHNKQFKIPLAIQQHIYPQSSLFIPFPIFYIIDPFGIPHFRSPSSFYPQN